NERRYDGDELHVAHSVSWLGMIPAVRISPDGRVAVSTRHFKGQRTVTEQLKPVSGEMFWPCGVEACSTVQVKSALLGAVAPAHRSNCTLKIAPGFSVRPKAAMVSRSA